MNYFYLQKYRYISNDENPQVVIKILKGYIFIFYYLIATGSHKMLHRQTRKSSFYSSLCCLVSQVPGNRCLLFLLEGSQLRKDAFSAGLGATLFFALVAPLVF